MAKKKKKIFKFIKLQIEAGKASPAPPVGPALGAAKVNIMDFCNQFNKETQKEKKGSVLSVDITVYEDGSFQYKIKSPPVSYLILQELGVQKGAGDQKENDWNP